MKNLLKLFKIANLEIRNLSFVDFEIDGFLVSINCLNKENVAEALKIYSEMNEKELLMLEVKSKFLERGHFAFEISSENFNYIQCIKESDEIKEKLNLKENLTTKKRRI